MEIVKARCNMCHPRCGINAYVENGKIVKIDGMPEHPWNFLCAKGHAIPELVHAPDRLTDPLIKVDGEFKKVTWDEAFGFIANKLNIIKQEYGPKSIVIHVGVPYVGTSTEPIIRRWGDVLGTPNYTSGGSFCMLARIISFNLTVGDHITPDYNSATKCAVLWGHNPTASNPILADNVNIVKGRQGKVIVVDPRAIPLARIADIHAQTRPGTDCALALGMLNVIIAEELYDKEFVEQWTVGFDKLVKHVRDYPPEKVADITWVPEDTIKDMARMYANNKPASISLGIAMDHSTNALQTIRAITTLMVVTGNIDVSGGNMIPARRPPQTNLRLAEKVMPDTPIGADFPLYTDFFSRYAAGPGEQQTTRLLDIMLAEKPYPIKAVIDFGCNLALTWPDSHKVEKAFQKLDLFVVCDIFMTDTCKMADVVLPGVTFMERDEIRNYRNQGLPLLLKTRKAVEPIGNSMEDWKIVQGIARSMGDGQYFPWESTEELYNYMLEPSPISLNQLEQNVGGIFYGEKIARKYLNGGFNTPSRKVEIYSKTLKEYGYDPIPTYHEPPESPISTPELVKEYPLIMITGGRALAYTHSQYRNLPSMKKMLPEPLVEINTQTATDYGIAQGDMVRVETSRGSIDLKATLTENILPGVISVMHGWSEANVNQLTTMDKAYLDPALGYPGLRQLLCRVRKAE